MAGKAGPTDLASITAEFGRPGNRPLALFEKRLTAVSETVSLPDLKQAILTRKSVDASQPLWADIESRQSIYILEDGLAYTFAFLPGGKRHIDDVFGPGAICNWPRIGAPDYKCNLMLKPNSTVTILDPAKFTAVLDGDPALSSAIGRHELARNLRNSQRNRALISLPAPHRLSIFLLDLREEYRLSGNEDDWLPLGFTQEEIADLAGMTEVHVNRTLAKMQDAGELTRRPGYFCLPNAGKLEAQLDYRRFTSGYSGDGHD